MWEKEKTGRDPSGQLGSFSGCSQGSRKPPWLFLDGPFGDGEFSTPLGASDDKSAVELHPVLAALLEKINK